MIGINRLSARKRYRFSRCLAARWGKRATTWCATRAGTVRNIVEKRLCYARMQAIFAKSIHALRTRGKIPPNRARIVA
jgi:hypothetical protein